MFENSMYNSIFSWCVFVYFSINKHYTWIQIYFQVVIEAVVMDILATLVGVTGHAVATFSKTQSVVVLIHQCISSLFDELYWWPCSWSFNSCYSPTTEEYLHFCIPPSSNHNRRLVYWDHHLNLVSILLTLESKILCYYFLK